jgi:hypothetical protein
VEGLKGRTVVYCSEDEYQNGHDKKDS